MKHIINNHYQIYPYFNNKEITTGILEIKDKYFFKALLKYNILYYKNIDLSTTASHIVFFSYYFMNKDKPVLPIINIFRNAEMKIHVSPGEKLFTCLTNHVLSLKLKTKYTVWDYNEIYRLINIMEESLSPYELFVLFCFIIQNYLFTFDLWDIFVFKLKYFKKCPAKDRFYLTSVPVILFFYSIMYLILFRFMFLNVLCFFFILFSSCYWFFILI